MINTLSFNRVNNQKARSLRAHAKRRAHERLGINLYRKDQDAIVSIITSGGAEFIEKQSNRKSAYRLLYGGKDMIVIYDCSRKALVTVLPAENGLRNRLDIKYDHRFPDGPPGVAYLENAIERVGMEYSCIVCGAPTRFIGFNEKPVCCDRCLDASFKEALDEKT